VKVRGDEPDDAEGVGNAHLAVAVVLLLDWAERAATRGARSGIHRVDILDEEVHPDGGEAVNIGFGPATMLAEFDYSIPYADFGMNNLATDIVAHYFGSSEDILVELDRCRSVADQQIGRDGSESRRDVIRLLHERRPFELQTKAYAELLARKVKKVVHDVDNRMLGVTSHFHHKFASNKLLDDLIKSIGFIRHLAHPVASAEANRIGP